MCGIWAFLGKQPCPDAETCVACLKARGPESTELLSVPNGMFGFTRLAINGLSESGMQPFHRNGITWMCNGEIYNSRALAEEYGIKTESGSDCEVLGELYRIFRDQENLAGFFRSLDGVFAIAILDHEKNQLIWGRDPYGVRPLFAAWSATDVEDPEISLKGAQNFTGLTMQLLLCQAELTGFCLASERKAIPSSCRYAMQFLPGHYGTLRAGDLSEYFCAPYHSIPWVKNPSLAPLVGQELGYKQATAAVRFALEEAVRKRLMTERPVAALLSGGIDSSLIASLVQKHLRALGLPALRTFSIGMPGSTDLKYARKVADWIGSDHTEIVLTADDFFNAIPEVIRDIESYDITSVRASVGNWLVSKAIREKSDCKVVFNGDGSDELFGSYLYFYNSPSDQAFEDEVERLLGELYYYDVLRSDRSISSHGLEARTPFLDKQFVATCRSVATCWRRPLKGKQMEKKLLRDAFDDGATLPPEVLWRQKEAFSDGVSSQEKSWFQEIQERVGQKIPTDWKILALDYSHCTPLTEEAFYYRTLYESLYGSFSALYAIPRFWMPRWSPGATDPSARTLSVYSSSSSIPSLNSA
jgi:asparagine synthase (glutamine-hydrolysing)